MTFNAISTLFCPIPNSSAYDSTPNPIPLSYHHTTNHSPKSAISIYGTIQSISISLITTSTVHSVLSDHLKTTDNHYVPIIFSSSSHKNHYYCMIIDIAATKSHHSFLSPF